jgi:drug/metabolite transporter (DMT)-like permease
MPMNDALAKKPREKAVTGFLLVLISAVAFGAMPVMARFAYAAGVDPISLLLFRFTTAGLLMLGIARVQGQKLPRGRTLAAVAAMGAVGYFGQSLSYFTALTLAPASLVALLLYLYPALVAGLAALIFKERLNRQKIGALVLATGGAALVIAPLGNQAGLERGMQTHPLGIILALSAAFIYSGYILWGSRVLKWVQPVPAATVIMLSAGAAFWGLALGRAAAGGGGINLPDSPGGWGALLGLSLFATVIAIVAFLAGMERIGPTNASLLSTLEPLVSVLLAAALLAETLTPVRLLGGGFILAAVVSLTIVEKSKTDA